MRLVADLCHWLHGERQDLKVVALVVDAQLER